MPDGRLAAVGRERPICLVNDIEAHDHGLLRALVLQLVLLGQPSAKLSPSVAACLLVEVIVNAVLRQGESGRDGQSLVRGRRGLPHEMQY
jgi:hypothetical protein